MKSYFEYKEALKKIYKKCESNQEKFVEGVWYLSNNIKELEDFQVELILNWHYIMTNGGKE